MFLNYHHFVRRFNIEHFVAWLHGTTDPVAIETRTDRLGAMGISVQVYTDTGLDRFRANLRSALALDGAVVCYHGHSCFTSGLAKVLGLSALLARCERRGGAPDITNAELQNLAGSARAKVLLLIGCSTNDMIPRRLASDTAVVTFDPGDKEPTVDASWSGEAMHHFYEHFLFRDPAPAVADAVQAANGVLAKHLPCRLVAASGDFSMTRNESPKVRRGPIVQR